MTLTFDYKVTFADTLTLHANLNVVNNSIVSYCITKERCDKSTTDVEHIHCYIEYVDCIHIEELCEYIRSIYDGIHLDLLRYSRSKKSCLKYITKEDTYVYTNIKTIISIK